MTTEAPVVKEYDIPITKRSEPPKRLPAPSPERLVPIPEIVHQPIRTRGGTNEPI